MPCYHPIPARELAPGRIRLKVAAQYATHWLPCGTCLGCRDAETAAWALRLKHESRLHSHNTFLTLTYEDDKLPDGLQITHMQLFWKRLRRNAAVKFKHFYCGEYGDRTKRPHYHAAVLGLNEPSDSKRWDAENNTSDTLNNIWGQGLVTTSELTTARMAYVAGYVLKKAGYKKQHFLIPGDDGIPIEVQAPFRRMSQGLGAKWLDKYQNDLRLGYIQNDDRKITIPRYYRNRLEKDNPELAEYIKTNQDIERKKRPPPDRERNKAAEKIRSQQIQQARRNKI